MVKVEVKSNPYLEETEIIFNQQKPRINSLVEKYQYKAFGDWVYEMPEIFKNEMNGYGFELEFSGTRLDYSKLVAAFIKAGVTVSESEYDEDIADNEVHFFFKGEMEDRRAKVKRVDEFLEWLKNNSNRRFNNNAFRDENVLFFENKYSYVIIHGGDIDISVLEELNVSIENIDSSKDLKNTDISSTPVLFCVDSGNIKELESELKQLLAKGISANQLFFFIHPSENKEFVERIIEDSGIRPPRIVASVYDNVVTEYVESYPMTEFVSEAIRIFDEKAETIYSDLKRERISSEISNKETISQIKKLEEEINLLQSNMECFTQKSNYELPRDFSLLKKKVILNVANWNSKKTKITKENEAKNMSERFDGLINKQYRMYQEVTNHLFQKTLNNIVVEWQRVYSDIGIDSEHSEKCSERMLHFKDITSIQDDLLQLKEEKYVVKEASLVGRFLRTEDPKIIETVPEVTYYYDRWRKYAVNAIEPAIDSSIDEQHKALSEVNYDIAQKYLSHIEELIRERIKEKEQLSLKLSGEERQLQKDIDWLAEYKNRLQMIERG